MTYIFGTVADAVIHQFHKKMLGSDVLNRICLAPGYNSDATQWSWRGHASDFLVCYIVSLDIGRFKKSIRSDLSAFVLGHYPFYPGGSC